MNSAAHGDKTPPVSTRIVSVLAAIVFTGCVVVTSTPPDAGPPAGTGAPTATATAVPTATATATSTAAECTPATCGPAPKMPNKLCSDGKTTSGPTGKCVATKDGGCGWEIASCPADPPPAPTATSTSPAAGQACGSRGMSPCPQGQFCNFPETAQCGATDKPGVCAPIPQTCTRELRFVCGCDGTTYNNPCVANAAGQSYSKMGKCP